MISRDCQRRRQIQHHDGKRKGSRRSAVLVGQVHRDRVVGRPVVRVEVANGERVRAGGQRTDVLCGRAIAVVHCAGERIEHARVGNIDRSRERAASLTERLSAGLALSVRARRYPP